MLICSYKPIVMCNKFDLTSPDFSVVGYFVGLGDRHVQNILIDKISAELIHIDLGKQEIA